MKSAAKENAFPFVGGLQIPRFNRSNLFFTADCKSAGTPSGRLYGTQIRRDAIPALGGIATTARSSFRLKSVSNPRKAVKVPLIPRNPMNNDTPSFFVSLSKILLSKIDSLCFSSNGGNYSFTIGKNLRLFIFGINNHLAF